jgi:hypothetical protein
MQLGFPKFLLKSFANRLELICLSNVALDGLDDAFARAILLIQLICSLLKGF